MATRYDPQGTEADFEPGSRGRVLRNLQGVRSAREMARRESDALLAATRRLIDETGADQRFTADDICRMHIGWLGEICPWAGQYRQVNMSKGGFVFAVAAQVPRLMSEVERGPLKEFTPCLFDDAARQARALAVVHTELVLIHPFREGNGRCSPLLAMMMGLQAGLPALDFGGVRGEEKRRYFQAVQAGLDRNYEPMTAVFGRIIARTLRSQAGH
jgi:cell filamentation protein